MGRCQCRAISKALVAHPFILLEKKLTCIADINWLWVCSPVSNKLPGILQLAVKCHIWFFFPFVSKLSRCLSKPSKLMPFMFNVQDPDNPLKLLNHVLHSKERNKNPQRKILKAKTSSVRPSSEPTCLFLDVHVFTISFCWINFISQKRSGTRECEDFYLAEPERIYNNALICG